MFCGNCGKELKNEENFCSNCGSKINKDENKINDNRTEKTNPTSIGDLMLTLIFSIIAFGIYSLVLYLAGFKFDDIKTIIMFALLSICSGFGLMRAYKYNDTSGL